MTVRTRSFRPFTGTPTSPLTRLLVLPRYAWREVFKSKLVTGAFTSSFLAPIGALVVVWLTHNLPALARTPFAEGIPFAIDGRFFGFLLLGQSYFAFVLTLFVGPSLVSPDLVNGALPLYLSRPLLRWQYVAGKLLVLALLLSAITWVPLLLVFVLEASLSGGSWLVCERRNRRFHPRRLAPPRPLPLARRDGPLGVGEEPGRRPGAPLRARRLPGGLRARPERSPRRRVGTAPRPRRRMGTGPRRALRYPRASRSPARRGLGLAPPGLGPLALPPPPEAPRLRGGAVSGTAAARTSSSSTRSPSSTARSSGSTGSPSRFLRASPASSARTARERRRS